jgi:hypothetical protein
LQVAQQLSQRGKQVLARLFDALTIAVLNVRWFNALIKDAAMAEKLLEK